VLEYKIYVYNFADLKLVDHIETTSNPKGLCALCPVTSNNVLVCPGLQRGHVRVELYNTKSTTLIPAHETKLACFALNFDGTRLATASEKGTLFRIFDTATGKALQEVRRGVDRAEIYSICFNANSEWLACSSDKGTIHVYKLNPEVQTKERTLDDQQQDQQNHSVEKEKDKPDEKTAKEKANPKSSLALFKSILPKYFSSEWSYAQYRVPDTRTIVAFGQEKNSIVVVSAEGNFYKAIFDPEKPGSECHQSTYAKFVKNPDEANTAAAPMQAGGGGEKSGGGATAATTAAAADN